VLGVPSLERLHIVLVVREPDGEPGLIDMEFCLEEIAAEGVRGALVRVAQIAPVLVLDLRPRRRDVDDDGVGAVGVEEADCFTCDVVGLATAVRTTDCRIAMVANGAAYLELLGPRFIAENLAVEEFRVIPDLLLEIEYVLAS
jgi:hypothetical protein